MTQNCEDGLIGQIRELAFGRANDAVKLLFLEPEQLAEIDALDLRMVSEIKRAGNGAIEVKLVSRLALLELLFRLMGEGGESDGGRAESFFRAMDAAAERLGEGEA